MKSFLLLIGILCLSNMGIAQNNAYPIFSYGDDIVYSDEFVRGFSKNNRNSGKPEQEEIDEYLQLYIKFKLKVAEAYARKMDTIPAFVTELEGYRKQLAQPYLTDKSVNEHLVMQAYERSQTEVNASHLLIMCDPEASPADSLEAYNKIMSLRNRIVKGGEDFEEMAAQHSMDPSAKSNSGNLGYFTAFQMIYPFENAAYTTPVGDVSMPIRTRFGYHLVYVKDRRKALGDVKVAHIMIKFYNDTEIDSAKRRIDAVYAMLKNGANWEELVDEFSEDFSTQPNGGELNWFNRTTQNVPVEFKDAAYTLENNGDYSMPFRTKYGWHIVKRIDRRAMPAFDEIKESIKRKVERDSRSELNKTVVLQRVKEENNFTDRNMLSAIMPYFDSTLLHGMWKVKEAYVGDIVLFTINDEQFTSEAFYNYILVNQSRTASTIEAAVHNLYQKFVDDANMKYEEAHLEEKYDDFKYIMQEYKDGILLFELTNKLVWSKAVEDSAGLAEFYNANKEKYMYGERVHAEIFSCTDQKTAKKARKMAKKGKDAAEILNEFNNEDALAISVSSGKFEKGKNAQIDSLPKKPGIYMISDGNGRVKFVRILEILPPEPIQLSDNLGQATSDYQNELERLWIEQLRQKYPVEVFEQNLEKLYN